MSKLDQIKKPIEKELILYEEYVRKHIINGSASISFALDYLFKSQGKGIRPILVFLAAKIHNPDRAKDTRSMVGAMLIEMTHTASLVHDDVVDEAYIRRGKPSINALWQSRTSILVGDYIFAQSYSTGMESGEYDVVKYISGAMSTICESELKQHDLSKSLRMTREIYEEIIYGKTATLLGICSGTGALTVGASEEEVRLMKEFGDSIGMAFQIKDDILDLQVEAETGKAPCNDLKERKITLPMLTVLESSNSSVQKKLIRKLSNIRRRPSNADYLLKEIIGRGGVEKASEVMFTYVEKAKALLRGFEPSPALDSLYALCDYIAERDK